MDLFFWVLLAGRAERWLELEIGDVEQTPSIPAPRCRWIAYRVCFTRENSRFCVEESGERIGTGRQTGRQVGRERLSN